MHVIFPRIVAQPSKARHLYARPIPCPVSNTHRLEERIREHWPFCVCNYYTEIHTVHVEIPPAEGKVQTLLSSFSERNRNKRK